MIYYQVSGGGYLEPATSIDESPKVVTTIISTPSVVFLSPVSNLELDAPAAISRALILWVSLSIKVDLLTASRYALFLFLAWAFYLLVVLLE